MAHFVMLSLLDARQWSRPREVCFPLSGDETPECQTNVTFFCTYFTVVVRALVGSENMPEVPSKKKVDYIYIVNSD